MPALGESADYEYASTNSRAVVDEMRDKVFGDMLIGDDYQYVWKVVEKALEKAHKAGRRHARSTLR